MSQPRSRPVGQTFEVLDVAEIWRVAEEWWRDHPIRRTYYRLVLGNGRPLTIFHDETSEGASSTCGGWYEQSY